ncbi:MAG: hypothetical protein R3C24_04025 [Cyanobacteriota/Melainabacteria group bacterium]|nr:tetratricopeptide repeat protein [Cyanobacteria bacterium HKST-UBA01]
MSGRKLVNLSLVLSVISMMSSPLAVLAKPSTSKESKPKPEYIMDTSRIGQSNNGMILSNQILELGVVTPSALRLQGEQAIRMGNISRAIQVLQKAVEMNPLDMDGRVLYATALEKKLIKQKKRDPKLYNYVIKQWTFVFKHSEFDDQKMQGRNHLINLVGRAPRWHESVKRYLANVMIAEDGEVAFGGEAQLQ